MKKTYWIDTHNEFNDFSARSSGDKHSPSNWYKTSDKSIVQPRRLEFEHAWAKESFILDVCRDNMHYHHSLLHHLGISWKTIWWARPRVATCAHQKHLTKDKKSTPSILLILPLLTCCANPTAAPRQCRHLSIVFVKAFLDTSEVSVPSPLITWERLGPPISPLEA